MISDELPQEAQKYPGNHAFAASEEIEYLLTLALTALGRSEWCFRAVSITITSSSSKSKNRYPVSDDPTDEASTRFTPAEAQGNQGLSRLGSCLIAHTRSPSNVVDREVLPNSRRRLCICDREQVLGACHEIMLMKTKIAYYRIQSSRGR